jgi:hypothetical protein
MNYEPPEISIEPNPFWRENAQKLVSQSISTIEEVAKQLIVVNSLLEGIYFHAITFSDVKPILTGWIAVLYLMPIALWLASLVCAVWTLSLKIYRININSSQDSKEEFEQIVLKKHRRLIISEMFLILSFAVVFIALVHYLLFVPASP